MRFCSFFISFLCCLIPQGMSGQQARIYGIVLDADSHLPITEASVSLNIPGYYQFTDSLGRFSYDHLPPSLYVLTVSRIGYGKLEQRIHLAENEKHETLLQLHAEPIQMSDLLLTSTRTSSLLATTSIPAALYSSAQLQEKNPVTLADAIGPQPGLALSRDGSWASGVSIRGLGRNNIVLLVDDVRMETATDIAGVLSLVDIHNVDRIEIIKGNASALYGTGSLGGVVHIVQRKPVLSEDTKWSGTAGTSLRSANREVDEHASVQMSSQSAGIMVNASHRAAENTETPAGTLPNSQYRDFSLGLTSVVRTVGSHELHLSLQRSQGNDVGIAGGSQFNDTSSVTYTLARRDLAQLTYTIPAISPTFPFLKFRYAWQDISRNVEVVQSVRYPIVILTPHATHTMNTASIEATIVPWSQTVLTTGVEYWKRDLISKREKKNSKAKTITGDRPLPEASFGSAGVFAEIESEIEPNVFTLAAGGRYDIIQVSNSAVDSLEYLTDLQGNPKSFSSPKQVWKAQYVNNESWSMHLGSRYAFTSQWSISAMAAAGYRSPSLEERFQYLVLGGAVRSGNPVLLPEHGIFTNLSLEYRGDKIHASTHVFLNRIRDKVEDVRGTFLGDTTAFVKINVGEAQLYGAEISLDAEIIRDLRINASASFTRGEDTRLHQPLPLMPPASAIVEARWHQERWGSIFVQCQITADQERLAPGELRTPGYTIFNFGVTSVQIPTGIGWIQVRGGVENLLNRSYRLHLSTNRGLIRLEPGRNFYLAMDITV